MNASWTEISYHSVVWERKSCIDIFSDEFVISDFINPDLKGDS
jgi:hypothetical protein